MSKENTEEVVRKIIEYANGEIKKVKETGGQNKKQNDRYWIYKQLKV